MADGTRIPTNLRTLRILEILGASDRPLTATEINQPLGLPKQTVHRLCATLEDEGYLARQGPGLRYTPARRLRALGRGLTHGNPLHIARHQILRAVADEVQETINFVVPEAQGMIYLDRVETDWLFRIQLPIGSHVPFHCTASGKCYLASLPPATRTKVVQGLTLTRHTRATFCEAAVLMDQLNQIEAQGYAIDCEEFFDGMVAMAVPISDSEGRFVAALAFHAPTQRVSLSDALARRPILEEGAARLSAALYTTDG